MTTIRREGAPPKDLLGRVAFADRVVERLHRTDSGEALCVALTGKWGDGKTATLRYMESKAVKLNNLSVTFFEPLIYNDEPTLVRSFYAHLLRAIGREDRAAAKKISKVLDAVGDIAGFVQSGSGFLGFGPAAAVAGAVKIATKGGAKAVRQLEKGPKSPEQLLNDARGAMRASKARVLFIIDEVDRLQPGEIISLLRLIRMVANFPNVTYLVAFDRDAVARSLAPLIIGSGPDESVRLAARYLEKIFEIEVPLPLPDVTVIKREVLDGLNQVINRSLGMDRRLTSDDVIRFRQVFDNCLLYDFRNLRTANRFLNQIEMILPEVVEILNVSDFLILEALRAADPVSFEIVRSEARRLAELTTEENKEKRISILSSAIERLKCHNPRLLMDVLFDCRRIENRQAPDETDVAGLRLMVPRFTSRYFSFQVASDDVPPAVLNEIVDKALRGDLGPEVLERLLREKRDAQDKIINDLKDRVGLISSGGALILFRVIVSGFPHFNRAEETLFAEDPLGEATRLAKRLMLRVDRDQWTTILQPVVDTADIEGVSTMLRWFAPATGGSEIGDTGAPERYLTPTEWKNIARQFALRLDSQDQKEALYNSMRRSTGGRLYWLIMKHADSQALKARLRDRFIKDPKNSLSFILQFVGIASSGRDNWPSDIGRETYNTIVQFIEWDWFGPILRKLIPSYLVDAELPRGGLGRHQDLSNQSGTMQAAQLLWFEEMIRKAPDEEKKL